MLIELKKRLEKGIEAGDRILKIKKISDGRFTEEENFEFFLNENKIFMCKIFYGRKPYYREWAEIFNVMDKTYFGSDAEEKIISLRIYGGRKKIKGRKTL